MRLLLVGRCLVVLLKEEGVSIGCVVSEGLVFGDIYFFVFLVICCVVLGWFWVRE